jgi:hypothetical protein
MLTIDSKTIVVHLLNSAWISQKHETPGKLYFPVGDIRQQMVKRATADLAVTLIHHPFNWYTPVNSRELRELLEAHSDLILTGHEHVPGGFTKQSHKGEHNEYLEGGVLQENSDPNTGSFNLVVIDFERGQQRQHTLTWNSDHFIESHSATWRQFERNSRLSRDTFVFQTEFLTFLDDAGDLPPSNESIA